MENSGRRRTRPTLFALGDEAVLLDPTRQELYALNATAAEIWRHLERRSPTVEIVRTVAQRHGVSEMTAQGYLEIVATAFRRVELAGAQPVGQPRRAQRRERPRGHLAGIIPNWARVPTFFTERSYRLLDSEFLIRYGSACEERLIHPPLAHLAAPITARPIEIHIARGSAGFEVRTGRLNRDRCATLGDLVSTVAGRLFVTAVRRVSYFIDVHAGMILIGESCLLLPGVTGTGKSTLTAALVHAGLQYGSDDVALLGDRNFGVRPVPISLCLKEGSVAALRSYYPTLEHSPIHVRRDGKSVVYLAPPAASLAYDVDRQYPVRWIVFPRYERTSPTEMAAVPKTVCLQRLLADCSSLPKRLSHARVRGLIRWIEHVDCFDLTFSSLTEAVSRVLDVCDAGRHRNRGRAHRDSPRQAPTPPSRKRLC